MDTLITLLQLFIITIAGFLLAKNPITRWSAFLLKLIPFVIYCLLFSVAFEATEHLTQLSWQSIVIQGATLSSLILISNIVVCLAIYLPQKSSKLGQYHKSVFSFKLIFQDLIKTLLALGCGVLCYQWFQPSELPTWISSWNILLFLMFLIGIDLAKLQFDKNQINRKMLLLPSLIMISSSTIALSFPLFFNNLTWYESLALAQGYGWYSMSTIMMNQLGNAHLGTLALIIDLSREIFAIIFIQTLGRIYPNTAIGLGGAASMDAALGMIKQSCGYQYIGLAVLTGLILSCFAPLLITLAMGLSP